MYKHSNFQILMTQFTQLDVAEIFALVPDKRAGGSLMTDLRH